MTFRASLLALSIPKIFMLCDWLKINNDYQNQPLLWMVGRHGTSYDEHCQPFWRWGYMEICDKDVIRHFWPWKVPIKRLLVPNSILFLVCRCYFNLLLFQKFISDFPTFLHFLNYSRAAIEPKI
jgi:hypothetical protein